MKLFANLPGNLRAFFGFMRGITILLGFFWVLHLLFGFLLPVQLNYEPYAKMTVGEIALAVPPAAIEMKSSQAKPGTLQFTTLRATLLANMGTRDAALATVLRRAIIPYMGVAILTAYLLFTALRNLCANVEVGEVFTDENLRLVRRVGLTLVGSSLLNALLAIWASALMEMYLREHAVLGSGLELAGAATGGGILFTLPPGVVSIQGGLVTGCLVLMITEVFRQGLKLKTENELTV